MKNHYIRLKSYSTIGNSSWIEIFERGYQKQILSEKSTYQEEILSLTCIHHLLNYKNIITKADIPQWLKDEGENKQIIISLSQRLLSLHEALIDLRERFSLNFRISIFLNTVMPIMDIVGKYIELKSEHDELVVNSEFSRRLISKILKTQSIELKVKPPMPELCVGEKPTFSNYNLENQREVNLSIFSRIIPGKLIHIVIKTMTLMDPKYRLTIYGFENPLTEYQKDLKNMIRRLNLEDRVRCEAKLNNYDTRIKALKNTDICINLSVTFEETLGKTILEACYWGKTVIANEWSGFVDILPRSQIINTFWSPQDWYYVRPIDLQNNILKVKGIIERKNNYLYQSFFENIHSHERRVDQKKDHVNNSEARVVAENLKKFKDRNKMQEIVEKIFAPNLKKENKIDESHKQHPWTILAMSNSGETNDEIIKKISSWKSYNHDSIYRSEANKILEILKKNKEGNA